MKLLHYFTKRNQVTEAAWIDEFIKNVRPYIFVRLEDNLLIKRPNKAQKLNPTGAKILKYLLDGNSIDHLFRKMSYNKEKIAQVINFINVIKEQLEGKIDEFTVNPAIKASLFEMDFSQYPVLSEIAITYRCNLKCSFCYAGCNCTTNPVGSNEEMSGEEIKKILWKIFHQSKVPSVSFTGGEPTLRPELFELIKYAKELGMRANLISNGINIMEKYAKKLADSGLDSAQISLEGITPDTHDSIVKYKGAYQKSIAAYQSLKKQGIFTHTNTTITKANIDECLQFPEFTKNVLKNDKFSMNLIIPTGSASLNDELVIKYSEIGKYLEQISENSQKMGIDFMWYSPVPMCMFNTILNGLGNKGCSACDGLISIGANGDILPCASFDDSVGNLLQSNFEEIWQSKKSSDYRRKKLAPDVCQKCENLSICNGACPLYWRHMGISELGGLTHVEGK